ncbi:hypothetical protein [Rhizobium etli]|nr:hypothetical protein [Rhizobium etli]
MAEVLSGEAPAPEKQVTVPLRRGRGRLRRLASRRRSYSFQQQTTNRPWPIGTPMRSSLKHLPEEQQRELARVVVLVGCSSGQKTSTVPPKRSARSAWRNWSEDSGYQLKIGSEDNIACKGIVVESSNQEIVGVVQPDETGDWSQT